MRHLLSQVKHPVALCLYTKRSYVEIYIAGWTKELEDVGYVGFVIFSESESADVRISRHTSPFLLVSYFLLVICDTVICTYRQM